MATRNVVITPRNDAMIKALVASGRYQNASEVLRDGLRMSEGREADDAAKLAAIRGGEDDMTAGRFLDFASAGALAAYTHGAPLWSGKVRLRLMLPDFASRNCRRHSWMRFKAQCGLRQCRKNR